MKRTALLGLLVVLAACGRAGLSSADQSRPGRSESVRENVVTLLEVGIGQARSDVIRPLIAPTYRQHNPRVSDGPEGLLSFVDAMADGPANRRVQVEVLRIFEDGDFVIGHSQYTRGGRVIAGFDIFRVNEGLFTEHWDAGQRQPENRANPHTTLDGRITPPDEHDRTAENKTLVERFTEEALIPRDATALPSFLAPDLIQHSPLIADGRTGWSTAFLDPTIPHHTELFRVLGEAEWVVTQSYGEALRAGAHRRVVIYDLYFIRDQKIVEHWDVVELIPERIRHDNGML